MCETYKDIAEQEPLPINLLLTLTQLKTHGDLTLVWKLNINPYALKSFLYIRSLMLAASLGRMNTEVLVSTVFEERGTSFLWTDYFLSLWAQHILMIWKPVILYSLFFDQFFFNFPHFCSFEQSSPHSLQGKKNPTLLSLSLSCYVALVWM